MTDDPANDVVYGGSGLDGTRGLYNIFKDIIEANERKKANETPKERKAKEKLRKKLTDK